MSTLKSKDEAMKKSENSAAKVAKAKELHEAAVEKAVALPCFGRFDCSSMVCFRCAGNKACTLKQQDLLVSAAVQAVQAKSPRRSATKKVERKVGLIELFAVILLNEKRLSLLDLLQKSMIAGAGDYDNMPVVGAAQVCTHLEHLSKNKSKPITSAGYRVEKDDTGFFLTMPDSTTVVAPMFGAW